MSLPSLAALEVLDTLAQTGSVSQTAQSVRLTQSAVSHKLRTMEVQLGFTLTQAQGRGVVLTAEARRYVAAIRPALQVLRDAHRRMGEARGRLEVAASSGLAATWLAPRIQSFLETYPEVSLTLISVAAGEVAPQCDLFIEFTTEPTATAEHLFDVDFFPVCSPRFLHPRGQPKLSDLTADMLLHLNNRHDWSDWLSMAGSALEPGDAGVMFTGLLSMYSAAEAGLGICLGDALTCGQALDTGRLVRPFSETLPPRAGYWITPAPGGLTAPASAFSNWLHSGFLDEPVQYA